MYMNINNKLYLFNVLTQKSKGQFISTSTHTHRDKPNQTKPRHLDNNKIKKLKRFSHYSVKYTHTPTHTHCLQLVF
jgi:hypothetical protein